MSCPAEASTHDRAPSAASARRSSPPPRQRHPGLEPPPNPDQDASPAYADNVLESPPPLESAPPPPQPAFAPLFTLVNNVSSRTTHHPRVYYLFSDDDPDPLHQTLAEQQYRARLQARLSDEDASTLLPPGDRAVVLDLVPSADGGSWNVSWASSLSSDWAVVGSRVSRAEEGHHRRHHRQLSEGRTGGSDEGDSEGERPLMLQIDGMERERPSPPAPVPPGDRGAGSGDLSGSSGAVREDPVALIEEFKKRMGLIRRVVQAGEEREIRLQQEQAEDDTPAGDGPGETN